MPAFLTFHFQFNQALSYDFRVINFLELEGKNYCECTVK